MTEEKCLVCRNEAIINKFSSREFGCKCVKCGDFKVEKEGEDKIIKLNKAEKAKLSFLIRNQNVAGLVPVFDNFINFDEILK